LSTATAIESAFFQLQFAPMEIPVLAGRYMDGGSEEDEKAFAAGTRIRPRRFQQRQFAGDLSLIRLKLFSSLLKTAPLFFELEKVFQNIPKTRYNEECSVCAVEGRLDRPTAGAVP
jgi:hypothetical protein